MKYLAVFVSLVVALTGCQAEQTPAATPAVAPVKERWVFVVGDSYTGGSDAGGNGDKGWPALVTNDMRAHGLRVTLRFEAEGGSGYVNKGQKNGVFADQLSSIRQYDDLLVFFGSRNDGQEPPNVLASAVRDTLTTAKAAAPKAKLLVIGPFWPGSDQLPRTEQLRVTQPLRDAMRDSAQAAGAIFVDPEAEGWLLDRPDLISADGVHPTDAGHRYLADRIGPLIQNTLA